jgi:hypothetical protein
MLSVVLVFIELNLGAFMSKGFVAGILMLLSCAAVLNPAMSKAAEKSLIREDYRWSYRVNVKALRREITTIDMAACPPGVIGSEPEYWVFISGPGNQPEAVKVTGGTCRGDGTAGTLKLSPAYNHEAGYMVGSASDGLQEALIAARIVPNNPEGTPQSGRVILAPGEYRVRARVSIRSSDQMIDMTAAIIECYIDQACLFVGDPSDSNRVSDITLVNPRGRPMVVKGIRPFIEDNAQKTRIINVSTRVAAKGASFGSYVQIDDDQSFLLDGLDTSLGYGVRCDATFCGSYVTAPGPFNKWSAVGWLQHLNISPQCTGNGVLWESGNTLRISDSVIQGYAQFGVRTGTSRGGYGGTALDNVYMETGNCTNPVFARPYSAGVIVNGNKVIIHGGEGPQGVMPCFTGASCSGAKTDLRYWIVANKTGVGSSNPFYLGRADSTGTGTIDIAWPAISGATSYDLLVKTASGQAVDAPYGEATFAVATGIPPSMCRGDVCRYDDQQNTRLTYGVVTPSYYPKLDFWPGDVVLASSGAEKDLLSAATLETDHGLSVINNELGLRASAVLSTHCGVIGGVASPLWVTCLGSRYPPQTWYEQGATIVAVKPTADGGKATNLKGRFNFSTLGSGPGHIITLFDSNFAKTVANRFNRPTNDPGDAFIGYDNLSSDPAQVSISFGAPKAISNYIGNAGDGNDWLERLTTSLKTFKVTVSMPKLQGITDTDTVRNLNADAVDGKHATDFAPYTNSTTCNSSQGGAFNYLSGGPGTKDTVRVCAKSADGIWAWRTVY